MSNIIAGDPAPTNPAAALRDDILAGLRIAESGNTLTALFVASMVSAGVIVTEVDRIEAAVQDAVEAGELDRLALYESLPTSLVHAHEMQASAEQTTSELTHLLYGEGRRPDAHTQTPELLRLHRAEVSAHLMATIISHLGGAR